MKTSVHLYRRSQEKQFSKDKDEEEDGEDEIELEMGPSVPLEGSSQDVVTRRSELV